MLILLLVLLVLLEQLPITPPHLLYHFVHLHQVRLHRYELLDPGVPSHCNPLLSAVHQQTHPLFELCHPRLDLAAGSVGDHHLSRLHRDQPAQQALPLLSHASQLCFLVFSLYLPLSCLVQFLLNLSILLAQSHHQLLQLTHPTLKRNLLRQSLLLHLVVRLSQCSQLPLQRLNLTPHRLKLHWQLRLSHRCGDVRLAPFLHQFRLQLSVLLLQGDALLPDCSQLLRPLLPTAGLLAYHLHLLLLYLPSPGAFTVLQFALQLPHSCLEVPLLGHELVLVTLPLPVDGLLVEGVGSCDLVDLLLQLFHLLSQLFALCLQVLVVVDELVSTSSSDFQLLLQVCILHSQLAYLLLQLFLHRQRQCALADVLLAPHLIQLQLDEFVGHDHPLDRLEGLLVLLLVVVAPTGDGLGLEGLPYPVLLLCSVNHLLLKHSLPCMKTNNVKEDIKYIPKRY